MAENRFLKSPSNETEDAPSFELPAPIARTAPDTDVRQPSRAMRGGLLPPPDMQPVFEAASAQYGVPINVLSALAQQESNYNPNAIGSMTKWGRAKGLMQNIDPTAQALGINPFDAEQSIFAAAKQMRERMDKGDPMDEVVMAHFGGDNRKQWGPKTHQYGREVLAKAGIIGQGLMAQQPQKAEEPSYDLNAIQAEMDAKEPGRFKVMTPEEVATMQAKGATPGASTAPETPASTATTATPSTGATDGFLSATGKALTNVPQNMKNSAGGIIRSLGEGVDDQTLVMQAKNAGILDQMEKSGELVFKADGMSSVKTPHLKDGTFADTSVLASYIRKNASTLLPNEQAAADMPGMQPNAVSKYGAEVSDNARKAMIEINPDGPLAKYGSMIIGSTAEMLPALTAAVITRNPTTMMGIMGGQVYGQSYDKAREKGMNPQDAGAYALAQAAAEAIPEALPLHFILKPGQQFFKGILKAGAAESLQEGVTQAIQSGIDKGTLDPNMTWGQAVEQIRDSMIVGAGSGALMRGGVHGVEKLTSRGATPGAEQAAATPEAKAAPQERIEPTLNDVVDPTATPGSTQDATTPATQAATTPAATVPTEITPAPVEPSGPLTRAAQTAVQTDGADRVTVETPTGTVVGSLESMDRKPNGSWTARVLADDGQFYQYTDKDDVVVTPEGQAAATPAQEDIPTLTDVVKPGVEIPMLTDVVENGPIPTLTDVVKKGVEIPTLTDVVETKDVEKKQQKTDGGNDAAQATDSAPESAVEPEPATELEPEMLAPPTVITPDRKAEASYEEMDEPGLRERLKYLAGQAKASGGWNSTLVQERKKVEKAIGALAKPETPKLADQSVELPTTEQSKEAAPVKWFGTQEKADAFISKKGLADTHQVVPDGKRFEIREKAVDGQPSPAQGMPEWAEKGRQVVLGQGRSTGDIAEVGDGWVKVSFGNRVEKMTTQTVERRMEAAKAADTQTPASAKEVAEKVQELTGDKINRAWTKFAPDSGTLDIPRAEMPQIKAEHRGAMVNFLEARGIVSTQEEVPAASLKPTQQEFSPAKVKKAKDFTGGDRSILVSSDGHVVDGHHQWMAKLEANEPIKVIRLGAPIAQLLDTVREFPSSTQANGSTATTSAPAAEQADTKVAKAGPKALGKNQDGKVVFEDENGVRSIADGGARITESVSMRPTREGMKVSIENRSDRFRTTEEVAERQPAEQPKAKPAANENKVFTEDAAERARALIKSKLTQLNSGFDPELMQAGITLAGYHIEKGARTFAAYAKAMTEDLGVMVSPYLKSWYMGVKYDPRAAGFDGMSSAAEVEAYNVEEVQDDTQPTEADAGKQPEGSQPGRVQATDQGREAATPAGKPDGGLPTKRGGRKAASAEPVRDEGQSEQSGGTEQRVRGDRADGAQPSRGEDYRNYRIQPGELKRQGSWKATAERNIEIVELVKRLEAEGRQSTPAEKEQLAKFTGWGASEIANGVFPNQYGQYKDGWRDLGERLKAAMTPEEYAQAKRTTQYAHYTSEPIIRSVYAAMGRLGFNGGQVLEPGMGVGSFNGLMPDSMVPHSTYTGIEYDTITGNIAKQLYPESNIIVGDFTQTKLPKDFFDAAIGNPPFGQIKIQSDPEYKKKGFLLHDYFFAKTIDRVKPGGVLVFVTSKGTMDKASDRARTYLSERADLLGAIRLPQTAFKDNAGTEVVTDVIFLRKRMPGEEPGGEAWSGLGEVQTAQGPAHINEYFAAHPEMVLGRHAKPGSMYRADEYTVEPIEGDIEQLFAKAVENLPENVYRPERGSRAERGAVERRDYDPKIKKEGGVYVADDGALMQVESGQGVPLTSRLGSNGKEIALRPREEDWLKGYTKVRDALKQAQYDQLNEGAWEKSLKELNKAYDAFTKEHGQILAHTVTERENEDGSVTVTRRFKNEALTRLDAEGALAYAMEVINADGTISKGAVLSGRTLNKPSEPVIASSQDAMFVSLNDIGRFDLGEIAKLAGKTEADVLNDLGTEVYQDPAAGWTTSDDYLSGNVVRKLKEAQSAARINKDYARNVEALKNVQPRALAPVDITVQLGSAWVPASDVQNFAAEVMGEKFSVSHSQVTGQWSVVGASSSSSEWGTGDKKSADILEAVLNNRQLKVTFKDADGKTHTDATATEKVNDIAKKLRTEFKKWIWSDNSRSERLSKYYNEHYNNIAPRKFDGSHLTLPGVSSRFDLRPHQKRAIWRTVQQGDTYYAHAVGAGKTFTMIASGMEERRLGLSKKPMYVVPNHMLAQFSKEFLELYPTAQIMVADETNFHTHNRRKFVAQAALNDPDAIVITHSAFGRIGMSHDFTQRFIESQIAEWQEALDESDKGDRVTRKQIERRIEQLENRLKGAIDGKKDQVLSFEELGVDRLYVDEGHEFRKLDFATNRGNIKGIDSSGSQRSMDLMMKVQFLREKTPGRALVMASGTPITNTMGELYTVQRFFQPEQLEEDGDANFDAWANHYGEAVDGLEQNAAGGYETVTRFAKFVNVPELMSRVRSFMDILTSDQLGDLVQRPDVIGGGRQVIVTPAPDGYKEYQKDLESRIKAIRNRKGPPKPGEDIILTVIADGRFSAIDMRFVDPTLPSDPNSKLNRTIDDMIAAYKSTEGNQYATKDVIDPLTGGSQMLFTDIGLGEQSAKNRGFDMKAWIEQRLLEGGVKPEHIAFMRDHKAHAKKERLFDDLRQGKKRILIGGKDMETGVNAQKRLTHLFHLDAPWFPASVEQREGRIVRQGNQNKQVTINAYASKGSYDSTMWGMNARKARFIEQAMSGDSSVRSLEDVSEASAFEMAAALASGDERYLKLAGYKADVDRLSRLQSAHIGEQRRLRSDKMATEASIKHNREKIAELKEAIAKREPIKAGEFSGKVGKTTYDSREDFSVALYDQFKGLAEAYTPGEQTIGHIGGFPIVYNGVELRGGNFAADATVDIPGDPDPLLVFPLDPQASVTGVATRAANQVNGMDRDVTRREGFVTEGNEKLEKLDRRIGATFPEQAELNEKQEALSDLESELEAESKIANADAAAATVETEGKPEESSEEPRYSLQDGVVQAEFGPVFKADSAAEAVERLMSDKTGEAIVTKDGIGDISLVYGDSKMGLGHIARRRGESFMGRLADLIENGEVYTKPGQEGRVFIGNSTDEAAIRLDWNGEAKTWLVSAYERYPDLKTGEVLQVGRRSQVLEERSVKPMSVDEVRRAITRGALGEIVDKMVEKGMLVIHSTPKTLPNSLGRGKRGVQAVTAPDGTIHLVANNLTPRTANAVLMHEMFHSGVENLLGSKRWGEMMGRLGSLYRQAATSTGKAGELHRKALARVAAAKEQGAVAKKMEVEEFGAYLVEEYERAPDSLPAAFRKWVEDLIGAVKAWLFSRHGKQLGALTPAQLAAMAKDALLVQGLARRGELFGPIAEKFSVNDEVTNKPEGDEFGPNASLLPDATALEDATKALGDRPQYKPDFVGQLVQDLGRVAKFVLHPRQIAALHKDFTPVYRTAIDQFGMRDEIIDEFQQDHGQYDALPQKSKEKVNAVLELGRLMSATYSEEHLLNGITNQGLKSVVKFTEGGSTYRAKEKINALLSGDGEFIQLNQEEADAYLALRSMFDKALDKFKDQTLIDFGYPELAGKPKAAKEILDQIDASTPPAKAERLTGIARFIAEIEQAKRTGYVPFARYGDYVVAVKEQQFPLKIISNPDTGGWLTRDLPSHYDSFMKEIGAEYNQLEDGYELNRTQRQALIRENEKTVYSAKVEFTLRDKVMIKAGKPVEEVPSVKKALAEAEKWKGSNPDRRVVGFEVIQKKPEGGVKLSDVDALAEVAMLDTDTWDAVRDQLQDAIKGKSFRKHFFQSDNVPGYTADFERAIADYMGGMAGYLSRRHYNNAWDNAISSIKAPRLFDYASKYRAYANEPQEELAMLRQAGFLMYIAGVPATAFVNLTQPFLMTAPVLGQIASAPLVFKEMGRAYKDALAMVRVNKRVGLDFFDPEKAPADIRDDLQKAWAEGMFVPLQTYEVMATARQRNVGSRKAAKAFNKTLAVTASLFSFAERLNRLVTFIASARLAKKPGVEANARRVYGKNALAQQTMLKNWGPESLADFMIDETQFRMGKANRPTIMRGVGAALMQFKGFVMQSLEAWFRLISQNGPKGLKAAALSIGAMVMIGGLWGIPGSDDLRELIEKSYKLVTSQDLDLKTELRKGMYDLTGQRWIAEVASKGATYPFGLDLSRVGMGNIAPDSPLQVFGIPADMIAGRGMRAFGKASQGDAFGAAGEFLPNFLKNPITAYGWSQNGVRDSHGRMILDESQVGGPEMASKSLGFQPSKITDIRDYEYADRRMQTANDELKRDYVSKLSKLIVRQEKNPDKAADIQGDIDDLLADIEEHNAKAKGPEDLIVITRTSMKNYISREMGGVKYTWGKERKQSRGASHGLREVFGLEEK